LITRSGVLSELIQTFRGVPGNGVGAKLAVPAGPL